MWELVRRFGLGHCDLPTQIWNVGVMLRVVALNIERGAKPIPMIAYICTAATATCYIFSYQVSMVCYVFVDCRRPGGDMLNGILVLSISLTSLIGITKLICMYIYAYQKKLQSAVAGYIAYDRIPSAPSGAGLLDSTMRTVKMRAMLCWATMIGNGILYNLHPLLTAKRVFFDDHIRFGLQLIFGTSNYLLVLVNVTASVHFICYVTSNITVLLIIIAGYSEARMLALGKEMRELWSDAQQHYRKNIDQQQTEGTLTKLNENETIQLNKYVKHRLHLIVQSHAINIDLVKKIEAMFRYGIALEFVLLAGGIIADLLGGLEQTYIILPFALMQVSMDCYIGQKLVDANEVLEYSVYDCKWENFDVDNMKTVLLILKMSQKMMSLSAGGIATLNFRCLMALYKSVYSAYTALRSTME